MEGDTTQPTRIDAVEYARFKEWVAETHGGVRGHLRTEIENALREYRQPDNAAEPIQRIEDDIATIKAQLTEVEADGGTPTPTVSGDTHARDEKPSPNEPRAVKIDWLIQNKFDPEGGSIIEEKIPAEISRVFDFEERTAEKYVQPLIDKLGAKRHPNNKKMLVWGERLEAIREQLADAEEGDA